MTRDHLLASARALRAPAPSAGEVFATLQDGLAAELTRRMLARPDVDRLVGAGNRDMMDNNSHNFLRFMGSMFKNFEPTVLVETVLWVFRAYRSHGFQTTYWPANIDTAMAIMHERLPADVRVELEPFFVWLIINIPVFVNLSEGELQKGPRDEHP